MIEKMIKFAKDKIKEYEDARKMWEEDGDQREIRAVNNEIEIHYMYLKELRKYTTNVLRDKKINEVINVGSAGAFSETEEVKE